MKSEILYHPVLNFLILIIGLSVCGAWWGVAAQAGDTVVHMAMGPMPMSNPLDGFGVNDFFALIWTGAKILFWLFFGLLGTFVVLLIFASVGVLTWVVQQLSKGFWYVSTSIRKTWDEMSAPKENEPVAKTEQGKSVTVKEVLADHEQRIGQLEQKQ